MLLIKILWKQCIYNRVLKISCDNNAGLFVRSTCFNNNNNEWICYSTMRNCTREYCFFMHCTKNIGYCFSLSSNVNLGWRPAWIDVSLASSWRCPRLVNHWRILVTSSIMLVWNTQRTVLQRFGIWLLVCVAWCQCC